VKGRSKFNDPIKRKAEIYQLIVRAGSEARWKTLKAHLEELRLGPTTLKQALDEMITEGSITKEARLGTEGAEVWYKIATKLDAIWGNPEKNMQQAESNQKEAYTLDQYYKEIKEKASTLNDKEKTDYLQTQMEIVFENAMESYAQYLGSYVRGAQWANPTELDYVFNYYINSVFLEDTALYQKILAEYPIGSLRAIHSFLLEDQSKVDKAILKEEKNRKEKISKMRNDTSQKKL
jgi:hypothetical protein